MASYGWYHYNGTSGEKNVQAQISQTELNLVLSSLGGQYPDKINKVLQTFLSTTTG
jgi:hypothetical protein